MKELKAQVKIEQILDILKENQVYYIQREYKDKRILEEYSYFSGREADAEYILNRLNRILILEGW